MKKQLLLILAALLSLVASAHDFEVDGIYYNINSETNKTVEVTYPGDDVTAFDKYSGYINIPSTVTYDGKKYCVTSIGICAFSYSQYLYEVTIPENVTIIDALAFEGCSYLRSITIPESVTLIGPHAFYGCELTNITFPENSQLTSIYIDAFDCTSWYDNQPDGVVYAGNILYKYKGTMPANTFIEVREGTVTINSSAFEGYKSLTSITIPESVTAIGDKAFDGTSWYDNQPDGVVYAGNVLYKYKGKMPTNTSIKVKEGTVGIGDWAFKGCQNLISITLPESVTSIGSYAFCECDSLKSITIPDGITFIKEYTFFRCSFNAINIPESVTNIETFAFGNCRNLTSITIPKSVTLIEEKAFRSCSGLTSITVDEENAIYDSRESCNAIIETKSNALITGCSSTIIPESVASIGSYAFFDCSLTSITCKTIIPPTIEGSSAFYGVDKSVPVYVPASSVEAYKAAEGWSEFKNIMDVSLKKCATPTISYVDGKVSLTCETEGAKVITDVVAEDAQRYEELEFTLSATYILTAYATKEDFADSDPVTLTLCWVPCAEEHKSEEDGILTIPSKPVLISARDGVLTLSGLAEGTEVALYTTDGIMVAQQQSSAGEAKFTVETNLVYLVHIGDKVVKIGM